MSDTIQMRTKLAIIAAALSIAGGSDAGHRTNIRSVKRIQLSERFRAMAIGFLIDLASRTARPNALEG